ncbi:MAG: Fic family protein [Pseudolabrys sp.]|nr:Fic family protein [Pseudolabrys sp.]
MAFDPITLRARWRNLSKQLQSAVATLDRQIKPNQDLTADQLAAVIDLCAWIHSEWVRIHPFANGNGRSARLWANYIAMRYGCLVLSACALGRKAHTMTVLPKQCRVGGNLRYRCSAKCTLMLFVVNEKHSRVRRFRGTVTPSSNPQAAVTAAIVAWQPCAYHRH